MPMPNRQTTDGNYRYAFQGQEKDPETGMEAFELRLWDGRLGRWLTTDPYSQYDSPYLGMGNNAIGMIDPDGGSAGPPTDYVYEGGNLLLHTNDGSNAVITVTNDKLADFLTSVRSSSWGLDTKAWNFHTKAWLVGNWNQGYENAVNSIDTAWARRLATDAIRTGNFGDIAKAEFAAAISTWTDPKKVIGGATVLVGGMSGSFRNTAVMATESEINVGRTMARRGYDVVLRDPVNVSGVRTSDLLINGIEVDVYTPIITNASRVISAIAKKNSQASQVIVDLSQTNLTPRDFGNAVRRVQNAGATNITSIVFINY